MGAKRYRTEVVKNKCCVIVLPAYLRYIHPMVQPVPLQHMPSIQASTLMPSSCKSHCHYITLLECVHLTCTV
jgi:hypothetical protein